MTARKVCVRLQDSETMVIFTNVLSGTSGLIGSRGARVTGADGVALSDGQERKQDSEDDPNINAHQSSPAAGSVPADTQRDKKAPGVRPGL